MESKTTKGGAAQNSVADVSSPALPAPPDRIYVNAKAAAIPMIGVYTLISHDGDIEYVRAPQWQPIETAPINESVLIYIPNAEHYGEGIYRAIWIESDYLMNGEKPRHWQTTGLHHGRDMNWLNYQPTHWMPLPAAPEVSVPAQEMGTTTVE